MDKGISHKVDEISEAIGKRYARTDELGIPFAITIDKETLEKNEVTLREIETMEQIRIPVDLLADRIDKVVRKIQTWQDLVNEFPKVEKVAKKE